MPTSRAAMLASSCCASSVSAAMLAWQFSCMERQESTYSRLQLKLLLSLLITEPKGAHARQELLTIHESFVTAAGL